MKVSYHAAQRFLERVVKQLEFSKIDVYCAQEYLQSLLKDVVISSYAKQFALPGFQRFLGIYQENVLVTIISKDKKEHYPKKITQKYPSIGEY